MHISLECWQLPAQPALVVGQRAALAAGQSANTAAVLQPAGLQGLGQKRPHAGPSPTPTRPRAQAGALHRSGSCDWLQAMCMGDRLDQLIQHALQMRDELLFKVLRNISQQDDVGVKERFVPYIDALVGLLKVGRPAACGRDIHGQACSMPAAACGERQRGLLHVAL